MSDAARMAAPYPIRAASASAAAEITIRARCKVVYLRTLSSPGPTINHILNVFRRRDTVVGHAEWLLGQCAVRRGRFRRAGLLCRPGGRSAQRLDRFGFLLLFVALTLRRICH